MTDAGWRYATVTAVTPSGSHGVVVRIDDPDREPHLPGQHYVLRLTAEDGYVAQRSYSIASGPAQPFVELGVDVLPDGEVSGFLADVVRPGDALEVRGPINRFFAWDGDRPALSIGGGSGVVPSVSMLRFAAEGPRADLRVLVGARSPVDLLFADELAASGATIAFSRANGPGRRFGRITAADVAPLLRDGQTVFVCGSAVFAEAVSGLLLDLGVDADDVRVERFGPSG